MNRQTAQTDLDNAEAFYLWAHSTKQPQATMDLAQLRFETALDNLHGILERLAA